MFSLLLAIIYISFISLGLPDSLLGSAWPVMHLDVNAPVSYAGIITMIIAGGTIISSLFSARLTRRLGAGLVTAISVLMTAVALSGFSFSNSFIALCLWGIPYGLGAGAVDSALNNYVALHYASRHMSWLHCFWGVGAAISPYIMSYCLTNGYGWDNGYSSVSKLQFVLSAVIFISLPLWKKKADDKGEESGSSKPLSIKDTLKIKGAAFALFTFFAYCSLEATAGLWASTYFVQARGIDAETAARFASLFYIGITVGRFLCGFITERSGDKRLIRYGIAIMTLGIVLVFLSSLYGYLALIGLVVIGFGCAPVYPCLIHATPENFGKENSQYVIGMQMASAYMGTTFIPPVFGIIAEHISISLYPAFMLVFALLMIIANEMLNTKNKRLCS